MDQIFFYVWQARISGRNNLSISQKLFVVERRLVGEVYLLIAIMQFHMSEDDKIKICSDLAEKGLAISQKIFVVDRYLVDEV